jgi:hypothetical protein
MIAGVSARACHSHIGSAIRGFYGPRLLRADALRHVLVAYAKSIAWRNMGTSDYSRNGRNQAVRIPVEFELPGDEAVMHRDCGRRHDRDRQHGRIQTYPRLENRELTCLKARTNNPTPRRRSMRLHLVFAGSTNSYVIETNFIIIMPPVPGPRGFANA